MLGIFSYVLTTYIIFVDIYATVYFYLNPTEGLKTATFTTNRIQKDN